MDLCSLVEVEVALVVEEELLVQVKVYTGLKIRTGPTGAQQEPPQSPPRPPGGTGRDPSTFGVVEEVSVVVQMGSLGQMWRLEEQVSLVQEGVPPQGAHSAVAENGLGGALDDTVHPQADGGSCHDGRLEADTQPEVVL